MIFLQYAARKSAEEDRIDWDNLGAKDKAVWCNHYSVVVGMTTRPTKGVLY